MLAAITRTPAQTLVDCELTYLNRQSIDPAGAVRQHKVYEQLLSRLGVRVLSLPAEPELPDAVFVEDLAVVTDEVAVITRPGAESRRAESDSMARVLAEFRPVKHLSAPATLEGGDVMRVGHTFYAGLSRRTNREGIDQLRETLATYGYEVIPVQMEGCLHLKTGCTYLGQGVVLANPSWIDVAAFKEIEILSVPESEPEAANSLTIGDTTILPSAFPKTRALLERRGFTVETLNISELQKAEAGLTCMSVIFKDKGFR